MPFSLRKATAAHLWWRSLGAEEQQPSAYIQKLFAALLAAYAEERNDEEDEESPPTRGRVRRLFSPDGHDQHAAKYGVDSVEWILDALDVGAKIELTAKPVRGQVQGGWLLSLNRNKNPDTERWGGRPTEQWHPELEAAIKSLCRVPSGSWSRVEEKQPQLVATLRAELHLQSPVPAADLNDRHDRAPDERHGASIEDIAPDASSSEDESQRDEERLQALEEAEKAYTKAMLTRDQEAKDKFEQKSSQIMRELVQRWNSAEGDLLEYGRRGLIVRRARNLLDLHHQDRVWQLNAKMQIVNWTCSPTENSVRDSPARHARKRAPRRR